MTPQEMASTHAAAFSKSRPWTEDEFADLLTNRFTHVVGNADSFAIYQVIADAAELLTIATHPSRQRQGLGLKTMEAWQAKAHSAGATHAILEVAADNEPAILLYQRCGYVQCGSRRAYYLRENAPNVDAFVMKRALP